MNYEYLTKSYTDYFLEVCDISKMGYVPNDKYLADKHGVYAGAVGDGIAVKAIVKNRGGDYRIPHDVVSQEKIKEMFQLKEDRENEEERLRILKLISDDIQSMIYNRVSDIKINVPKITIPTTKVVTKKKKYVITIGRFKIFGIEEI